jgi:AraC-like DNA-binding protein
MPDFYQNIEDLCVILSSVVIPMQVSQVYFFNPKFVSECAKMYSLSTGLGCSVSDANGAVLYEYGFGCHSCTICDVLGLDRTKRFGEGAYAMSGGGKFGGVYIYFCQMGLASIAFPVPRHFGSVANIAAGPFLIVDLEDFIAVDLKENFNLDGTKLERVVELLEQMQVITSERVVALSNLLFLTLSSIGGFSAGEQASESSPQNFKIAESGYGPEYPVATEKKLMESIANSDKPRVRKLLNELLGHIFFSSGGNHDRIKNETYELLVMISREAIDVGVPKNRLFRMNRLFWWQAQSTAGIDEFCTLLSDAVNKYIDIIFDFSDKKNSDVVYKAIQYIYQNYSNKITLEDVAKEVFVSPVYFCRIFKKEVGCNFNTYLNQLRIEKSKQFLLMDEGRIADVVSLVGFEDQSYFTKVFKKVAGVSPKYFRKTAEVPQTLQRGFSEVPDK